MPAEITPAELLQLVAKLKIEDSYNSAAEQLAKLTEDKTDDQIRRRVADADAVPKLGNILKAFIESIELHAEAKAGLDDAEKKRAEAVEELKEATAALEEAEEKMAKAGDFTEEEEEEEKKKGVAALMDMAKEKKEEYFRGLREKEKNKCDERKTEAERVDKKTEKNLDAAKEHEEAMLNRRIYLEDSAANVLQVLINVSRSKPNRLLIDQCECVQPTVKLLDMEFKQEVYGRAVMLLINVSTGPEMAGVHQHILDAGGVKPLVEMIKLGPTKTTSHRAIQVLSLISLNDGVKDAFREEEESFEALAALLASEQDGLYVKHAALCGNHLCEMNVPNKLAFMEHGCIPPMMALIKKGPASPLTDIVVHTITSLAVGNELCDPVITNSGPLPFLVELINNQQNPKLTLPSVTAVMHMAREDVDAKSILTIAGIVPKLKECVSVDKMEEKQPAKLMEKAISALSNLANNSQPSQDELHKEGVMEIMKSVLEVVPPNTKMAQVCIAFFANFASKNTDTAQAVKDADIVPLVAYHHLNGRAANTRESKAGLIALGTIVNMVQESADLVGDMFSQLLLHECLEGAPDGSISIPDGLKVEMDMFKKELAAEMDKMRAKFRNKASNAGQELESAANNMMTRITGKRSIKEEVKMKAKADRLKEQLRQAKILEDMTLLAGACLTAADFVPKAKRQLALRKDEEAMEEAEEEKRKEEEAEAVAKEEADAAASKEKEVREADEAREELRKAQAEAAKQKASAAKEVAEAKAAKKDLEAAEKAVTAKRAMFKKEKELAEQAIVDKRAEFRMLKDAAQTQVASLQEKKEKGVAEEDVDEKIAAAQEDIKKYEEAHDGQEIKDLEALVVEKEAAQDGDVVKGLLQVVEDKKTIFEKEQREADEAEAEKTRVLDEERKAKDIAKKEIKEARAAEIAKKKQEKITAEKKARIAAGLHAESQLTSKGESGCCIVM